jgi:predicted anti-sigma-YlaC factor YlaD
MLEKHLQSCDKCIKEYKGLKNTKMMTSFLNKEAAPADFERKIMEKIKNGHFTTNWLEYFIATARTSLIASILIFGVIAAFNFFTPLTTACSNVDNVEAINNYVLKGNIFAKQNKISDAKIIEALFE